MTFLTNVTVKDDSARPDEDSFDLTDAADAYGRRRQSASEAWRRLEDCELSESVDAPALGNAGQDRQAVGSQNTAERMRSGM